MEDLTTKAQLVKSHYERVAKERSDRLENTAWNLARINHSTRAKIIGAFLNKLHGLKKGIDIGTGTGVWAEVLTGHCEQVTGIDFAQQNVVVATENAAKKQLSDRLTYMVDDAVEINTVADNTFDIATQISVLQHLPDQNKAISRVNDILTSQGHLIILVHNRQCIYNRSRNIQRKLGTETAINNFNSPGELTAMLRKNGFEIVAVRFNWLFLLDILSIGVGKPALGFLEPLRRILISLTGIPAIILGRSRIFHRFFREIVILARKKS